ncbi:hypothetical protein CTM97_18090 [Photobacterium phosphoreum]|uniref:DUF2523 domain-containing protein n=1 Tax=Photobacterium phosphoreum TaxID=659 RepID=A0A2T3JU76_PHOPO|nr:DUF2523 family protein [Photobacterium phosphoreum]PSU20271.1 hypothetical protein CTM96_19845 [Photobacterium phosphoreum]PSU38981.1 hypothetical protein CTM97_18090 [Photobacterium phosphoreum]PSU52693.1 hypothetical protein C9J18_09105 [Photobacterium phosphoreum]
MDYIYSFFEQFFMWFKDLFLWLNHIPDFLQSVIQFVLIKLFIVYIEAKIFFTSISMNVAKAIITEYGVYDLIELSFNKLPPDLRFVLTAYGVPEGFRIIFDAFASSLILRFIGR